MRIGFGYDVHRLAEGRPLVLGGVRIDYPKGLLGHSDADVVVHAIIDALIGAAGLGDIGKYFPPDDPQYKNISSLVLLEKTLSIIKEKGFLVSNVDASIVCEKPKLLGYIPVMTEKIAGIIGAPVGYVNIKATTEEGLGFTGSGEAISAYAVALIMKRG